MSFDTMLDTVSAETDAETIPKRTRRFLGIGPQNDSPAVRAFAMDGEPVVAVGLSGRHGAGKEMLLDAAAWKAVSTLFGQQQQGDQFNRSSMLNAASTAGSQALGYQTADANARIAGNSQLGTGLTIGQSASTTGLNGTLQGYNAALGAATTQQTQDQNNINNNVDLFNAADMRYQNLLNDYWKIVGTGNNGGTSMATSTNPGGVGTALTGALGGGIAGYQLGKNFTGMFGGSQLGSDPINFPSVSAGGFAVQ